MRYDNFQDRLRYDTVDSNDTRMAIDQMQGFLKSVDQNVDQEPLKVKEGQPISGLTL